jgi:hypothetical protein
LRAESKHHPALEGVGFALRIGPEKKMPHLVIESLDPHSLALVDAASFPVFWMDEMDAAVFVGFAGGLAPIDILVPFNPWRSNVIVAAECRDRAPKRTRAMGAEKFRKVPVDIATKRNGGDHHSHDYKRPPDRDERILWAGVYAGQFEISEADKIGPKPTVFAVAVSSLKGDAT